MGLAFLDILSITPKYPSRETRRPGETGQHTREANVMTSGHRRTVGAITMLLGMVVALTSVLAACGWGQVDESQAGMVNGSIGESKLGPGKSASGIFDLTPGKYVLF